MLVLENLAKHFGGLQAVAGVTYAFPQGRITGLIGPNGAGKTTIFNMITGLVRPSAGRVTFDGRDITGLAPHRVARLGLGRTFQQTRIFLQLSVLENAVLALPTVTHAIHRSLAFTAAKQRRLESQALESLALFGLGDLARRPAGALSYGEQKVVMLACLLSSGARTLLLDEPTGGIDPSAREGVLTGVLKLRDLGRTIVLIEHNLDVVRGACEDVVFLAEGRVLAHGTPAEIEADARLTRLYFGGGHA
jgi:ABC-type branched-subunit amino acid transport system ATPase component